ncbi:MAG: SDR family NAD(P)-dependent oxidoreductase [Bacteroidales bacterium]
MTKIALVTGVTSGIGQAVAERLAKEGFSLIVTGRRKECLMAFAKKLQDKGISVLPLCFDVRDSKEVEAHLKHLPQEWQNIDVLVNNAGLAVGLNPLQSGIIEDWERMIDTNVKGLLYVSRSVLPLMIKQQKGHVINLGSIAGKEVYPNGNVYCATKHAVDAISKGMRMDTLAHNIKVTQICPGAVETEFSMVRFKGDKQRAEQVYKGFHSLKAEDIADAIAYCVNLPEHVNINDMVIMPTAQANSALFSKK